MEYRVITSFENTLFLFSRRKAGLLPPRPLREKTGMLLPEKRYPYRVTTLFLPTRCGMLKTGLSPPRPLRDLCASAWKNGDVTSWKTIPLQSDTPISPVLHEILKTDLSPFFYSLRIYFLAEVTQRTRSGTKGSCHFFKNDNPISFHSVREAEKQACHLRAHCETSALSVRKNRDLTSWQTIIFTEWQLYFFHTARDTEKQTCRRFFTACIFIFSQRLRRERGENQRGIVAF